MSKPLIYIDLNVIWLQMNGKIDIRKFGANSQWVYSKIHFDEIRNYERSDKFLGVLNEIGAQMIELQMDGQFQIQDSCILHSSGSPFDHFAKYKEAISEVNFEPAVMHPQIAWCNGNREIEALKNSFSDLTSEFEGMLGKYGLQIEDFAGGADFKNVLEQNYKNLSSNRVSIEENRSAYGSKYGFSTYSEKENPLKEIWKVVQPLCPDITSDQFFGFSPYSGNEKIPKYLAIISCCAILDVIGFQAEKKSRKIEKISNVQSDASHIAYSIFCAGLLSGDNRLCQRARAIFRYANLQTTVFKLKQGCEKTLAVAL